MATLNIVTVQDVRDRYSLENLADVNTALTSGLNGAHVFFQGILGTVFEKNLARVDVFYLDDDLFTSLPNGQFRLRLKQAFLQGGITSIVVSGTRQNVMNDAVATAVPGKDYTVDVEKGLVYIDADVPEGTYRGMWVRVTYTAGFDSGQSPTYVAPDWLKEAVLAWMAAIMLYSSHTAEPRKVINQAQEIQHQAAAMVERYKRETAFQLSPVA